MLGTRGAAALCQPRRENGGGAVRQNHQTCLGSQRAGWIGAVVLAVAIGSDPAEAASKKSSAQTGSKPGITTIKGALRKKTSPAKSRATPPDPNLLDQLSPRLSLSKKGVNVKVGRGSRGTNNWRRRRFNGW